MHIAQYNMILLYAIEMCSLNFLPCSHAINPNNETCLVTCAVSHRFSFDLILNQATNMYNYMYVCAYACIM